MAELMLSFHGGLIISANSINPVPRFTHISRKPLVVGVKTYIRLALVLLVLLVAL